jgi:glucose-1-phosphate thymidylyltransferase
LRPVTVEDWYDCGNAHSLIVANRYLLDRASHFKKRANSIIIPPCHIDDSAEVTNSIVGPYVSIGEAAIVESSIIKDTIIDPFAEVENSLLSDTIIGQKAIVRGTFKKLNVGDSSELEST